MSYLTSLKKVGDALGSLQKQGLKVNHYRRFGSDAPYCIWQEDSDEGMEADNKKAEQGIAGTVDLYTLTEYDGNIELIQAKLDSIENLSYRINSIQYEEDTNLIHYEWRWWLYG